MKTRLKIAGLLAFFTLLFSFTSNAQTTLCPWRVTNGLTCPVTVDIYVYEDLGQGCNVLCNTILGVPVAPGASAPIPCGGCRRVCNIKVVVRTIDGIPCAGGADFSTACPGGAVLCTGRPSCISTGTSPAFICYDPVGFNFKIHP